MFKTVRLIAAAAAVALALVAGSLRPAQAAFNESIDGNLFLNCATATATAGAATAAGKCAKVTSESITTAAGAVYTLTVTASGIAATDQCYGSVDNGTNSAGSPVVTRMSPTTNQLVVLVQNVHASAALNGTIKISYFCNK